VNNEPDTDELIRKLDARQPRTPGELLFERYLQQRRREFQYEEPLGGARPDFRVTSDHADVICEVVEPEPTWPASRVGSGPDMHAEIRALIHRKRRQGKGAKGRMPYVMVVRPGGGIQPYEPFVVIGAMLGDVGFNVPVAPPKGRAGPITLVTTQGGRMQTAMNTRFSALAILRIINPTRHLLDEAIRAALRDVRGDLRALKAIERVQDELTAQGTYDPDLEVPRVDVFHNPYAATRLPLEFFDGAFDRQWAETGDGNVRLALEGISAEFVGT